MLQVRSCDDFVTMLSQSRRYLRLVERCDFFGMQLNDDDRKGSTFYEFYKHGLTGGWNDALQKLEEKVKTVEFISMLKSLCYSHKFYSHKNTLMALPNSLLEGNHAKNQNYFQISNILKYTSCLEKFWLISTLFFKDIYSIVFPILLMYELKSLLKQDSKTKKKVYRKLQKRDFPYCEEYDKSKYFSQIEHITTMYNRYKYNRNSCNLPEWIDNEYKTWSLYMREEYQLRILLNFIRVRLYRYFNRSFSSLLNSKIKHVDCTVYSNIDFSGRDTLALFFFIGQDTIVQHARKRVEKTKGNVEKFSTDFDLSDTLVERDLSEIKDFLF